MVAEPGSLDVVIRDWRERVNQRLAAYMQPSDDCPVRLREAMSYSLLAGGKRLRPLLTLLACEAAGGNPLMALPAACALEMVHTYSLIHDDLPAMDDDDFRRGRPTNHKVFGEALAILAGDALLTLAFEVVARDVQPAAAAAACCADLASAAGDCGMVAGQVVDIEAETMGLSTVTELEAIHRRKTGRLITCALTMGGRIAQVDAHSLEVLRKFGQCVGLAFQITDDLLDVSGNPDKLGKGVQKDAEAGKLTYPGLLGIDESRRRAEALIDEAAALAETFGPAGGHLVGLARFVGNRDH
ncbi:MAG: farnesyl-diphosphate synthase [Planctomycetales bacterium 12-60-4]|nr:MAG: farnesyl-diphosphate synthase [Planctomycetales bacterium 12-60-4]